MSICDQKLSAQDIICHFYSDVVDDCKMCPLHTPCKLSPKQTYAEKDKEFKLISCAWVDSFLK